jgi:hypothetical protein
MIGSAVSALADSLLATKLHVPRARPEWLAPFLVETWRLDLPEAGVAALVERTEGWATGLQLAAL